MAEDGAAETVGRVVDKCVLNDYRGGEVQGDPAAVSRLGSGGAVGRIGQEYVVPDRRGGTVHAVNSTAGICPSIRESKSFDYGIRTLAVAHEDRAVRVDITRIAIDDTVLRPVF